MFKTFEIEGGKLISIPPIPGGRSSKTLPLKNVRHIAVINRKKLYIGIETGEEGNRHFLLSYSDKFRDYFFPNQYYFFNGGKLLSEEGSGGEMEKYGVIGDRIYYLSPEVEGEILTFLGEATASTMEERTFIFSVGEKYLPANELFGDKYISGNRVIARVGNIYYFESGFTSTIVGCYLISLSFLASFSNSLLGTF